MPGVIQISRGLSVKASLAIFSGVVAVIFVIVGLTAYSSAGSVRGIVEKSNGNAAFQERTGYVGRTLKSIRGNVVTYDALAKPD